MSEKTIEEVPILYFAIDGEDIESKIITYLLGRYFCSTAIDFRAADDDDALEKVKATLEPISQCVRVRVNQDTLVYPPIAEDELEVVDLTDCEDQEQQRELAWIKHELLEDFVAAHEDEGSWACLPQRLCSISQTGSGRYRLQMVASPLCWSSRDLLTLTDALGRGPAADPRQRAAQSSEWSLLHHWLEQALVEQHADTSALAALRQRLEMQYPFSRFWANNLNTSSVQWAQRSQSQLEDGEPGESHPPTLARGAWEARHSGVPVGSGCASSTETATLLAAIGLTVCLYIESPVLRLQVLGLAGGHPAGRNAAMTTLTLSYTPETTVDAWINQIEASLNAPATAVGLGEAHGDPTPAILIEWIDCTAVSQDSNRELAALRELDLANPAYPWTFSLLQTAAWLELSHSIAHGSTAAAETEVLCQSIPRMHRQLKVLPSASTLAEWVQAFHTQWTHPEPTLEASCGGSEQDRRAVMPARVVPEGQGLSVIEGARRYDAAAMALQSASIAQAFRGRGAAPQRVMVLLRPGARYVAAVQCMVEDGHTYMTCDDSYPLQRVLELVQAFKPEVLLYEKSTEATASAVVHQSDPSIHCDTLEVVDGAQDGEEPPLSAQSTRQQSSDRRPATGQYVIYTSGSTGVPKAIEQTVSNALFFASQYAQALAITSDSTITQIGSIAHDATIVDIYTALITGCTLFSYNIKQQGLEELCRALNHSSVDVLHCTPSVLRELSYGMLRRAEQLDTVSTIALGGEQVLASDLSLIKRICSRPCRVMNLYGSSEASFTFKKIVDPDENIGFDCVPIGRAVDQVSWRLIDSLGQQNPFIGQLQIECQHSYQAWGATTPPAESTTGPLEPQHRGPVYETGDWGRRLHNGEVLCLGRQDSQVKIRGFRVSMLEIEHAICRHAAVKECCVITTRDESGNLELAAFAMRSPSHTTESNEQLAVVIKQDLLETLPMYMVPAKLLVRDSLPKTATGKINRRELALN